MATTPNLGIQHITEAQSQKFATANTGLTALDKALCDTEGIVHDNSASYAVTSTEFRENIRLTITGTLTNNRILTVPDTIKRFFFLIDNTTGDYTLTVNTVSGSGVTIPVAEKGNAFTLFSDGTDVSTLQETTGRPLDYAGYVPGGHSSSQILCRIPVGRGVDFPADFAGSAGEWATATVGAVTNLIYKASIGGGGETLIGSMIFAALASTATFTTVAGTAKSLTAGQILIIKASATPDGTANGLGWTLVGTRTLT